MKKIHYLKTDENLPLDPVDFEPIIWVYRWDGKFAFAPALKDLIKENYWPN